MTWPFVEPVTAKVNTDNAADALNVCISTTDWFTKTPGHTGGVKQIPAGKSW